MEETNEIHGFSKEEQAGNKTDYRLYSKSKKRLQS
jgi:hypothetical protein